MLCLYKSLDAHIRENQKKRDKYDYEYQMSGSTSSGRTKEKYSDLYDICMVARAAQDEEDQEKKRRLYNSQMYINKVIESQMLAKDKTYTGEELLNHLRQLQKLLV